MNHLVKLSVVAASVILSFTGCSTKSNELLIQKEMEIEKLTKELSVAKRDGTVYEKSLEKEVKNLKSNLESNKNISQLLEEEKKKSGLNSLVPPNPVVGECYSKVLFPATYEDKEVKKLVREAKTEIKVKPATYKLKEERIMVKEATTKLVNIPETYKSITETIMVEPEKTELISIPTTYKSVKTKIMVEPEKTKLVTIPATYKTIEEKILVSPAYTTWKKGKGEIQKVNNATGEIMCFIEVPAVYKSITKKVLDVDTHTKKVIKPAIYKSVTKKIIDKSATTKEVKIPAVYKSVTKRVVDKPATTKKVEIPAVYKIVKTKILDTPVKEEKIEVSALYDTYTTKIKISEPHLEWQSILCETNTDINIILKLQKELQNRGYDITRLDGVYGPETRGAVDKYQKDNTLSRGALTLKTLKSLGLLN